MRFLRLCLMLLLLPSVVLAQPNLSLTPGQYKFLNDVQDLLTQKEYATAEEKLTKFESKLDPSFALALAYQLHGQIYLMQEQPEKGLQYFEKTLAMNVLEPAQEVGIAITTAQILLSLERAPDAYQGLEPRLERLLKREQEIRNERKQKNKEQADAKPFEIVPAQGMATLATAFQINKEYKRSIPWLKRALKRSESPQENWLLMLMVANYQEKNYEAAAAVLDDLQRVNPSKEEYWVQQAALYLLLDNNSLALRSLELGYASGNIQKPTNIMQLIQLLIGQGLPERAARILNERMQDGSIELTESNWRLLTAAWVQSREREQAAQSLKLANRGLKDGKLLFRAAQLYSQNFSHKDALSATQEALRKGLDDKEKAQALMLAANSAYELKDLTTARRYFQQALAYPDTASNAKSWLDYITNLEEYGF